MQQFGGEVVAWLAAVGAMIGVGQLLRSKEPITWRLAMGRAVVSAGLAMAAGSVLVWIPGLPFAALIGIGAGIASLGTSGVEKLLRHYTSK